MVVAELSLDDHLDAEGLAVESVVVALVETGQRLVALEDVLQRAAPGRVYAERLVGGNRAVDESPDRSAPVALS